MEISIPRRLRFLTFRKVGSSLITSNCACTAVWLVTDSSDVETGREYQSIRVSEYVLVVSKYDGLSLYYRSSISTSCNRIYKLQVFQDDRARSVRDGDMLWSRA